MGFSSRSVTAVFGLFLLHALAREVDRALGIVLGAELEPDGLLSEVGRALASDASGSLMRVALWIIAAAAASFVAAWWARRARRDAGSMAGRTDAPESGYGAGSDSQLPKAAAWPLLLRPAVTLLALLSVAIQPAYPYAFTLPVALTQDWGLAQDLLALAAILAAVLKAPRFTVPRPVEVFTLCFLAYAALVPEWAWHWDSHPGNEPKTLRQAVALGHWLSFDAEPVTGPMEALETRPLAASLGVGVSALVRESGRMFASLAAGGGGRGSIRATRIARQLVRGKDGGVYTVLAPGPSLLLAPALRLDRAINRARGVEGRVAVSVLLFCALGAWLVAALNLLLRDATGRPELAAALSFFFALLPPFLFYFYQFYPEMLGALVLAMAFRTVALRPEGIRLQPLRMGVLVAVLPWLHQKFLPVWGVLLATALLVGWLGERARMLGPAGWRWAAWLLAPSAASVYLFALYNFAITGSIRPDALFLAWGPGGVTSARIGQGLLGLLLDARYGILPYVPLLVLAGAGLVLGGARQFATVLPAAAAYYLTVASADNWSGAVCNLGRYVMPVLPLTVALVAMALARTAQRRGAATLALALAAWAGAIALALRADPHAANDSWLLLAKSTFADGWQYIPGLFIRNWADAAPGLAVQLAAWFALLATSALWLRRAALAREGSMTSAPAAASGASLGRTTAVTRSAGASSLRVVAGLSAILLVAAFVLERAAPTARTRPAWQQELPLDADTALYLEGEATVRGDEALVGPGAVEIRVRETRASGAGAEDGPLAITATVGGNGGFVHVGGRPPQALRPSGALVEIPLRPYHVVRGEDANAVFFKGFLWLEQEAVLRPHP